MEIIKANETHIPEILEIYAKARKFMKENGNPTQWEEGYPSREIVEKDIAADHCYVCMENEKVVGVFVFIIGEDPTYRVIYQGAWRSETEYGTIPHLWYLIFHSMPLFIKHNFCIFWSFNNSIFWYIICHMY